MGDDGSSTIKCALGRLQPSVQLRSAIESTVERLHVIALRGSFVATEAWTTSSDNPPLINQTWWFRCFASTYSTRRGTGDVGDEAVNAARDKLFAGVSPVKGDYIWSFVAELAREAMTATHNMVASSFHKQILKALRREVVLHEVETNTQLDKSVRHQLVSHYYDRAVGHQRATVHPDFSSAQLEGAMNGLLADWSDLMESVGPCPTDDFIYNDRRHLKLPALMCWMARLQRHRIACVERMEALVGSEEEAQRRLRRLARAQAPLPFFSWQVKHIAVSNTGLKALVQMAGSCATGAKPTFEEYLPGLARFQKLSKPFQNYLRTDGVSVSLVMQAKTDGRRLRKRHRKADEQSFPVPLPGQRVVGIDPGRRDLIALVSNQEGDHPFTVSTKSMEVDSGRRQARIHTRRVLRTCRVADDEEGTEASLLQKLGSLPSRRADWNAFCAAALPILDTIACTYEKKSLRRQRFSSYMKRDRALDELCKRIMGGKLRGQTGRKRYTPGQRGTLVAFGAANACSTGFGYAPAPQERLRRRLERIHGARVFLIDEFRTSQLCWKCHQQLDKVTVQRCVKGTLKRFQPHGLRRCTTCHNEKGAPLYCHRDVNAAQNILTCFLSKATTGQRPEAFSRQTISQTNPCSSGQGLGFAVRLSPSEEKPSKRTRRA